MIATPGASSAQICVTQGDVAFLTPRSQTDADMTGRFLWLEPPFDDALASCTYSEGDLNWDVPNLACALIEPERCLDRAAVNDAGLSPFRPQSADAGDTCRYTLEFARCVADGAASQRVHAF